MCNTKGILRFQKAKLSFHGDVIKWKHFPLGIQRSPICALNIRLSKQSWDWWFETPSHSWWRHCNEYCQTSGKYHLRLAFSILVPDIIYFVWLRRGFGKYLSRRIMFLLSGDCLNISYCCLLFTWWNRLCRLIVRKIRQKRFTDFMWWYKTMFYAVIWRHKTSVHRRAR